jgi:GxxExxY protein
VFRVNLERQTGGPLIRADERRYPHGGVTADVIGAFYDVYNELGRGFVEAVYRRAMAIALGERGVVVDVEAPLTVRFRGVVVGAFRADLVVAGVVVVEVKACRALAPEHEAQLLNYLRASGIEVGLLLNFGPGPTVRRFAFTHPPGSVSR